MKVLLLLDHAPDYRESFLSDLAKRCELTVLAHPCEKDNLKPPRNRSGYVYHELANTYGSKIRFNFQLKDFIRKLNPDVICVALNVRFPIRISTFLFNKSFRKKWIWWGQVYGRNDNALLLKLKRELLLRSAINLVYSDEIAHKIKKLNSMIKVLSFDNSQFSAVDFKKLPNLKHKKLHVLFVGRPQKRKRLEMLIKLGKRRRDVSVRLVGPGMQDFFQNSELNSNIELFPGAAGETLEAHFEWCNIVLSPGHVGLLVMNSAAHNRPIVIDSTVSHAPEVILAKEANQQFLNFSDDVEVDRFLDSLKNNPVLLQDLGDRLFGKALGKYTVERMAENHMKSFQTVQDANN